jgi:hypothetical protein
MVIASTVHDFGKIKKFNKLTKFRFVKMLVIDNLKGKTVGDKVSENIQYDTVAKTDNYRSYSKKKEQGWCHIPKNVNPKEAGKVLPWVHTIISNAKPTLLGVHNMISTKYTQNYLDEFCSKVNPRDFGDQLSDRLLIACVTINYQNLIKHDR